MEAQLSGTVDMMLLSFGAEHIFIRAQQILHLGVLEGIILVKTFYFPLFHALLNGVFHLLSIIPTNTV